MNTAQIKIKLPKEFDFQQCLLFLDRNDKECLHQVKGDRFIKPIQIGESLFVLEVSTEEGYLVVKSLNKRFDEIEKGIIEDYMTQQFDLQADLGSFYRQVEKDPILGSLVKRFYGLRLLGMPDLFECLIWSVIGQQINLNFAYTLKQRLVHEYGEKLDFKGETYYFFPSPKVLSQCAFSDLQKLSFSKQKINYTLGIAEIFAKGALDKKKLEELGDLELVKKELIKIKGIGNWTAQYVAMKCLLHRNALPIEDVGLHNAIKYQLDLDRKPTLSEIRDYAENWQGWEAYATFYLWQSLL